MLRLHTHPSRDFVTSHLGDIDIVLGRSSSVRRAAVDAFDPPIVQSLVYGTPLVRVRVKQFENAASLRV
jgi:hypothetical protein